MKVEKYVREDGKVAVLYSRARGGWSTWCTDDQKECLLFDKNIVEMVLQTDIESRQSTQQLEQNVKKYVDSLWGDSAVYCGGVSSLDIEWMEPGTKFVIHEHDGNEGVIKLEEFRWNLA
jgi:hypothetical protein